MFAISVNEITKLADSEWAFQ